MTAYRSTLRAILAEATTADSGDEACAENTFKRIAALADAALNGSEPPEWANAELRRDEARRQRNTADACVALSRILRKPAK